MDRVVFRFRKMMPDYVFSTVKLEGNPFTYPEVQTLLEGITVGGHKLTDAQQVINQKDSCNALLDLIEKGELRPTSKNAWCFLNALVAEGEALVAGEFRTENVGIGGTEFVPPPASELHGIFDRERVKIDSIGNPIERAYVFSAWAAVNQFFWDGNKRTGRLIMNGVLMENGYDALSVPAKSQLEYNQACLELYDTENASSLFEFLRDRHLKIANPKRMKL